MNLPPLTVVGGGLAGCEAAWQMAEAGYHVRLCEMRPVRGTDAHQTDQLAELVCSNSFRNNSLETAVGLLKEEMRRLGSLVMRCADAHAVPAGAALAVDRERFAIAVTAAVAAHPRITLAREEVTALPDGRRNHRQRTADVAGAVAGACRSASVNSICISTTPSRRSSPPTRSTARSPSRPRATARAATTISTAR